MALICNVCGLPGELCICQEIAKDNNVHSYQQTRRYGKIVTKVEGLDDAAIDINKLAKLLKGSSVPLAEPQGRVIELQGDHKRKQQMFFVEMDTKWRCDEMNIDIRNQTWVGKTYPFTTRWMKH